MDGLDLSQIKPLREAEAETIFDRPGVFELYQTALVELEGCGAGNEVAAIRAYVEHLKRQINSAYGQGRSESWTRPGFGEMGG